MGQQLNDPSETRHFKPPTVHEALEMINQVLSPIYSQVLLGRIEYLLERIAELEAENQQLHQENERLRGGIKSYISNALRELGLKD